VDLGFSTEHDELRSSVRRFVAQECPRESVRSRLEQPDSFDRALWQRAAQLGWAGLLVPDEYGGGSVTNQPLVDLYVLVEELGRRLQPWPVISTNIVAAALARSGSDLTRKNFLAPLLAGDATAAWCFPTCYPGGNNEPGGIEVARHGSDYRIDGIKSYVLDAKGTDFLLVDSVTDGSVTRLVIPTGSAGVTVVRRQAFDLTRRIDQVRFEAVAAPRDAVLDAAPVIVADLARDLRAATAMIVADCVGGQETIMNMSTDYAKLRVAFGRTIGSFQAIKHKLADMYCLLESSRGAAYYAALAVGDGFPDAEYATSAAKSYVCDAYVRMAHDNIETHGGIGFTWDHDAHLFLRRAMTNQLLLGASKDHREQVFALATDDHF
jgi:alkylation response protein AidB-like acyl-CoA dehydrogenase